MARRVVRSGRHAPLAVGSASRAAWGPEGVGAKAPRDNRSIMQAVPKLIVPVLKRWQNVDECGVLSFFTRWRVRFGWLITSIPLRLSRLAKEVRISSAGF